MIVAYNFSSIAINVVCTNNVELGYFFIFQNDSYMSADGFRTTAVNIFPLVILHALTKKLSLTFWTSIYPRQRNFE